MTSSSDVGFWAAVHNPGEYRAACLLPCELAGLYPTASASLIVLLTSVPMYQQCSLGLSCVRGPQISESFYSMSTSPCQYYTH